MKEVLVHDGPRTELIESPVPKAGAGQLVIKVEVSGTNPKDFKTWFVQKLPVNMGDDFAGTVHEVGADVDGFAVGDRVFAFHQIQAPHGSYAEYAVAHAYTTAHLPAKTSYEEAATIPLAALTAALSLHRELSLPQPWTPSPSPSPTPLLIYGGSSAVGAFAIKLARWSHIHPIIAVAGAGSAYVSTLLDPSKGDAVIDYRPGDTAVESGMRAALAAAGVESGHATHALDAIGTPATAKLCVKLLAPGGKLAYVLPVDEDVLGLTDGRTARLTVVSIVHGAFGDQPGACTFGQVFMQAFARGLVTGEFKGHPYKVVPGGLGAVPGILEDLKAGKVSAVKYVFRVRETEGL